MLMLSGEARRKKDDSPLGVLKKMGAGNQQQGCQGD